MQYIFVGCYCEDSQKDYLYNITRGHISISATTFQNAILDGLHLNNASPNYIINLPAIGSFPRRCSIAIVDGGLFESYSKGINCGFVNITYLKKWFTKISLRRQLYKTLNNRNDNENLVVLIYSLMYPYLSAVIELKKMYPHFKVVAIVPDMPEFIASKNDVKKIYELSKEIDGFVLLTKQMAEKLNVGERPYSIMEGVFSLEHTYNDVRREENTCTILYTGTLDKRYGIINLIENFLKVKSDRLRLKICGSGTIEEIRAIQSFAKKNNRIIYLGILKRHEVLRLQKEVSFLINPRDNSSEFTKFSFPSKTMEYLASGTPTIMYPLAGVPDEYLNHAILLDETDKESISKVLQEITSDNYEKYKDLGLNARDFIISKKNAKIQVRKIIDVIGETVKMK